MTNRASSANGFHSVQSLIMSLPHATQPTGPAKRKANTKRQNKTNGQQAEAVFRSSLLRRWGWVVILGLLLLFQWNGGIAQFSRTMAANAIDTRRLDTASWWLSIARQLSADGETEYLMARVARRQGHLGQMLEHLKAAHQKDFDAQKLDREQLLAFASLGRFEGDSEQRLNEWLQEPDSDRAEIFDAYANGLTLVSRFEHAMEVLQTWQEFAPQDPLPSYRMARIHEHFSQTQEAESAYRKSIEKQPTFKNAAYHLARVLLDQRRPEEALEHFGACNSGATALAARIGMARCHKSLGDIDTARKLLIEVMQATYEDQMKSFHGLDEFPERYVAASELGIIETELGNFSEACEKLEAALQRFPLDSIARYSYAVALRGLNRSDEAEANFETVRRSRAALDEVSSLQELLRSDPQNTEARIKIGKIILEHESQTVGEFWIQSVFAYEPHNQEAHRALAEYYALRREESPEASQRWEYHSAFLDK